MSTSIIPTVLTLKPLEIYGSFDNFVFTFGVEILREHLTEADLFVSLIKPNLLYCHEQNHTSWKDRYNGGTSKRGTKYHQNLIHYDSVSE